MAHDECANWDYKRHPGAPTVRATCGEFLVKIRMAPDSQISALRDTKPFHFAFFKQAVPHACTYLAGEYRGSDHACLKHRVVGMGGRCGAPCAEVERLMRDFHDATRLSLAVMDSSYVAVGQAPEFLLDLVAFIAQVVSSFQDIHPYADGNGHIGRLLVWVIMGHYQLLPERWWLHDNPGRDWDEAVSEHQRGNTRPLQEFLLTTLFK